TRVSRASTIPTSSTVSSVALSKALTGSRARSSIEDIGTPMASYSTLEARGRSVRSLRRETLLRQGREPGSRIEAVLDPGGNTEKMGVGPARAHQLETEWQPAGPRPCWDDHRGRADQ